MLYLTDTHPFVWFQSGEQRRLGAAAKRIFSRAERGHDEVRLSTASLFEIVLLIEARRLRAPLDWDAWVSAASRGPGFAIEPVGTDDIARAREVAGLVDPFDRLIVGTALRLRAPLITVDERIMGSGLVRTTG